MHDSTSTCPRHNGRDGDPWCLACRRTIETAILELPDLHRMIAEADRNATPNRAERRPVNADPRSPSPYHDDADEIASILKGWAECWREHLGELPPASTAYDHADRDAPTLLPCCAAAADAETDADIAAHDPWCPWRAYVAERARHDREELDLPATLSPRASATYLLRHRRHADLLSSPLALDLGEELRRLHGAAQHRVGNVRGEPAHERVDGLCPWCDHGGLYRVDGTDDVTCPRCGDIGSVDEYAAFRRVAAWEIEAMTA